MRRLEHLHLKILKKKQSMVFNQTCLYMCIYIYIYIYIYREREREGQMYSNSWWYGKWNHISNALRKGMNPFFLPLSLARQEKIVLSSPGEEQKIQNDQGEDPLDQPCENLLLKPSNYDWCGEAEALISIRCLLMAVI